MHSIVSKSPYIKPAPGPFSFSTAAKGANVPAWARPTHHSNTVKRTDHWGKPLKLKGGNYAFGHNNASPFRNNPSVLKLKKATDSMVSLAEQEAVWNTERRLIENIGSNSNSSEGSLHGGRHHNPTKK
jgi:hypothetical protein